MNIENPIDLITTALESNNAKQMKTALEQAREMLNEPAKVLVQVYFDSSGIFHESAEVISGRAEVELDTRDYEKAEYYQEYEAEAVESGDVRLNYDEDGGAYL
jgi:hypothetical protein